MQMVQKYKISDLVNVAAKGQKPPACDETLQVTVEVADNGIARGQWQVDEKFLNGNGVAMGGFLSSAADIMMAYAIASKLTDVQAFSSIDLQTTFHRPTFPGKVDIEARVERLGRTVVYLVADLSQNGKKVATSISSVLIQELK
jgi:acyl-CoA thioesterase